MKTHQYQRPDAPAIRQKRDYMTSMLAIVFFILVAVNAMYALPAGETPTGEIDGRWVGQFKTAGVDILIRTRFNNNNNSLNGAISIPQEDKYGLPVTFSPSQDNHITFQFKGKKGVFKFEGKLSKNTINGTISCEDRTSSLTLHRYKVIDKETYQQYIGDYRLEETNQIFLFGRYQNTYMLYYMDGKRLIQIYNLYDDTFYSTAGERVSFIKAPTGGVTGVRFEKEGLPIVNGQRVELYKDEEITFTSGKYKLAGTLLTPLAQGPHPVVIFVAGSGRCDRESQRLAAAAYFARRGIAAFIYDKRGCGKSEGNWFKLTFEDRADDILAALSYLKGRSEIAADKIGLWGFSQGGWLTPLAASKSRDVAFIIPVAGAGISVAEQDLYNIRNQMAAAGFSEKVIDSGLNFMKYSYQLNRLDIPLLDNVFPAIDFYYEPVPALEAVTQPVLAIWGGSDSCVPPVTSAGIFDRVLRKSGHDNFTLKIFPGADHGVRVFRHDLPWAVYPDGYLDGMVRWVSEICGNKITAPETNEGINNYKAGMDPGNEIIPGTDLPWYGGAAAQFGYIVVIMLLFLPAIILWPLGFLIRRIRKRPSAYPGAPLSIRPLAAVSGVLMITVFSTWLMNMFNFTGSDFSAIARLHDMTLLRIAAYLLIGITAGMVAFTVNTWKKNHRSLAFRIYYSILTLLSVLFIPWMSYWNLLF